MILDALAHAEEAAAVQRLAAALGGAPSEVSERHFGEPATTSRRLRFASGGELILHDDLLVAVLLHTAPSGAGAGAVDLAEWIEGARNSATLDDLKQVIDGRRRFAGFGVPYFEVDGGYVRAEFRGHRGWNEPGNLDALVVTSGQPGLTTRPEDDDCPSCSSLLVRGDSGCMEVAPTVDALAVAKAAGDLAENPSWVALRDLIPLHASGLMERVESQLTCARCRRILCITLRRGGPATLGHHALNEVRRHRLGAIPPVVQWGSAARIAEEQDAMHYVDHEPGRWFLLEQGDRLYLDARYVVTDMVDDSALIELDAAETEQYRADGRAAIEAMAERIAADPPHREASPFSARDLQRGPESAERRDMVSRAIVNHSWLAQQRSRG